MLSVKNHVFWSLNKAVRERVQPKNENSDNIYSTLFSFRAQKAMFWLLFSMQLQLISTGPFKLEKKTHTKVFCAQISKQLDVLVEKQHIEGKISK